MKRSERRQFQRQEISIPCAVEWQNQIITGRVTNLSFGGAFVSEASMLPAKGAEVDVTFRAEEEKTVLKAKVTLSHRYWKTIEDDRIGYFGLEFQEPAEEIRSKLIPVLRTFLPSSELEEKPPEN